MKYKVFELLGFLLDTIVNEDQSILFRQDDGLHIGCSNTRKIIELLLPFFDDGCIFAANSKWLFATIIIEKSRIAKIVLENHNGATMTFDGENILDLMYDQGMDDIYFESCSQVEKFFSLCH